MPPSPHPREPTRLAPAELRYLVLAAQREGHRQLNRQLLGLGLTASQAEILLVLRDFGPLTLKQLGELIVCETGSPSRIVDTLVRRGLVARSVAAADRRAVALALSPSGDAITPALNSLDRAIQAEALASFEPEQLDGLVSSLRGFLRGTVSEQVLERRFGAARAPLGPPRGAAPDPGETKNAPLE